jgi:hypothetical protein
MEGPGPGTDDDDGARTMTANSVRISRFLPPIILTYSSELSWSLFWATVVVGVKARGRVGWARLPRELNCVHTGLRRAHTLTTLDLGMH